jgi:hypothetical protein
MLVEIIIETDFRAIGAILEYAFRKSNGENYIAAMEQKWFYISFLQHVTPQLADKIIKIQVHGSS